jgi:hypothetical protein
MARENVFSRTTSGKANKGLFIRELLVYVEGDEDVTFFSALRSELGCRFESADGKGEAEKLAKKLLDDNYPYAVILDGDFDVVLGRKIQHPRVVYLSVYSIENFLANDDVIREFIEGYCACDDGLEDILLLGDFWDLCGGDLRKLVTLDIARAMSGLDRAGIPDRIDPWLAISDSRVVLTRDARARISDLEEQTPARQILAARRLLEQRSDVEVCCELLRGHLIFGIVRKKVFIAIKRLLRRNCVADNRMLLKSMSEALWRSGLPIVTAFLNSARGAIRHLHEARAN